MAKSSSAENEELLEWVKSMILPCTRCPLSQSRRNAVPGEGNPHASLMLVGEAPGASEDAQGRPFVGASGRLLSELLASIGLRREQVFITNVVKCRPPANREPQEDEILACNDFLLSQIALIQPKVIATLGRHAGQTLIASDLSISRSHGRPLYKQGIFFVPLFHPAYALYNQAQREVLKADMLELRKLLIKAGATGEPPRPRAAAGTEE
jgi:uracil-DNA glycosylase